MYKGLEVKANMFYLLPTGGRDKGKDGVKMQVSLEVEARVAKVHIEGLAFLEFGNANADDGDIEEGL